MARGAGAQARRDLMRETTCRHCGAAILHVSLGFRSVPERNGRGVVSMPPGTRALLNPQPEDAGWYVLDDDRWIFDPEGVCDGPRFVRHNC